MPTGKPSPEDLLAKADDRLGAARLLHERGFYEDSIGRSYFAMLTAARALLAARSVYPKTHKGVLTQFGMEFVKPGLIEELEARALAKAREQRDEADYAMEVEKGVEESESTLEDAERFLEQARLALQRMRAPRDHRLP